MRDEVTDQWLADQEGTPPEEVVHPAYVLKPHPYAPKSAPVGQCVDFVDCVSCDRSARVHNLLQGLTGYGMSDSSFVDLGPRSAGEADLILHARVAKLDRAHGMLARGHLLLCLL